MADAIPVHKPQARPIDPVKDLVKTDVSEDTVKSMPAEFQKKARRALEDGHEVSIIGEGRAMRIDFKHVAQ